MKVIRRGVAAAYKHLIEEAEASGKFSLVRAEFQFAEEDAQEPPELERVLIELEVKKGSRSPPKKY